VIIAMLGFTTFRLGHRVDGELIVDCPYCHRRAVGRTGHMIRFVGAIRITQEGETTPSILIPVQNKAHVQRALRTFDLLESIT
jgi:hypothetical protein